VKLARFEFLHCLLVGGVGVEPTERGVKRSLKLFLDKLASSNSADFDTLMVVTAGARLFT
jgi:hypothetical protein